MNRMAMWTMIGPLLAAGACSSRSQDGDGSNSSELRAVAFFQSVEVPVFDRGSEVAPSDRNAPLIAGRQAIVRAKLDLPEGWTTGDLELAVDIVADGVTRTFSTTETMTASSADEDGIVVPIPADAMVTGAEYAVRLREGQTLRARLPVSGTAPLGAIETGPLDVRLVPFDVNGFVPDTSTSVVEGFRAALQAVYPVTEVRVSVGEVQPWAGAFDIGDINVQLGVLQEEAMTAGEVDWNVYFFGMVTGVATREEFDGPTGTSESGGSDALVRAYFATGAAFGDQRSEDTLIHEFGHVHGLGHSPCDGEDDVDPDFPYSDGTIGVEGYDFRTGTFVPADTKDMMSYCYPRWISDYGYAKIAPHVAAAQDFEGYE